MSHSDLPDGILIVDKPGGLTSHDVVLKIRKYTPQKKVGFIGTLDPLATGVLPICIGKATKLSSFLSSQDKEYLAHILLGIRTDTDDISGRIVEEREVSVPPGKVKKVVESFTGDIEQIPPLYSAIKRGGKKLYQYAREGKKISLPPRKLRIHSLELADILDGKELVIKVRCSKGTYIRSLARDIGKELGCGATLKELRRLASGNFDLSMAHSLVEIHQAYQEGSLGNMVMPPGEFLKDLKAVVVRGGSDNRIRNGAPLTGAMDYFQDQSIGRGEHFRVEDGKGEIVAIYRAEQDMEGEQGRRGDIILARPYIML
ncbi:tRNA pseudouridine(55) synthase TruB [Candidatus Hakubella thermalkaliphila]|uniref:tRNA pseudouridine synthase B n=1 Tax=Candidatus Hakubella thermalkaliphila TaxID=2754717 RepID=A0A6V8P4Q8_9ACTN|nr:tRNA pseudouridine(55) synthase TruB [Candidatus Hakubella thermalkaliphila]GFP27602.1 tRNA pseudouridine55 synthase [Candidatus Hakubella thermalkaliphila]